MVIKRDIKNKKNFKKMAEISQILYPAAIKPQRNLCKSCMNNVTKD